MIRATIAAAALLLSAGCEESAPPAEDTAPGPSSTPAAMEPELRWEEVASGEGDALRLVGEDGALRLTIFCPAAENILLVNVPAFDPVGSEERMSFGADDIVWTLVANPSGDSLRGGVSGKGPVSDDLGPALAAAETVAVNYGAQNFGPVDSPPAELARTFVAGCTD